MDAYTKPNFESMALITIDTQMDTLQGGRFAVPGTSKALPQMAALAKIFRQLHKPIIHIIRIYKKDGSNADICRRRQIERGFSAFREGSDGCAIAPDILPQKTAGLAYQKLLKGNIQKLSKNEAVIYKPRWGAFYHTPLAPYLAKRNIDTLLFTGCNYPSCLRVSIFEASQRDYRIIMAPDAVSGFHQSAEKELKNISVQLIKTADLLQRLGKSVSHFPRGARNIDHAGWRAKTE